MHPPYPLIVVYENRFPLLIEEGELDKAATSIVLKPQQHIAYDYSGNTWTYHLSSANLKPNFITKLLAFTFYNPMIDVNVAWQQMGSYTIHELQSILKQCVDEDDDILTQFVEPDDLKQKIDEASNFEQLRHVLEKYVYQVDEEELEKEFPSN